MKQIKQKQTKQEKERLAEIEKMIREANKEVVIFVKKNAKIEPRLQHNCV